MTALTRTGIINLALREIGTDRIENYTDSGVAEDVANDVWDQAVLITLSRHEWRFAMRSASLPRSSTTPTTRYEYAYTLPGDFVRLGSLSDMETMEPPLDDFSITENGVETNATAVYCEYVYNAPSEGAWSPWFVHVFVADLASFMAGPLKHVSERERLEQLAEKRLREGRSIDSQHQRVRFTREGSWIRAARGYRVR